MFSCRRNLCASASFYLKSRCCMEFILTAAWGGSAWRLPALNWFPLAIKTKRPSGVCDGLVTCPGSIPVSRLMVAGRGLDKQPSRLKKPVFPETPVENWHTVLNWGHLFSTVTNSSSTPMLTRPNFLKLPLSFTPLWIFNYTDKELRKPLLIPLSPSLTARLRFLTCPTWELHLSPCT